LKDLQFTNDSQIPLSLNDWQNKRKFFAWQNISPSLIHDESNGIIKCQTNRS